MVRYSLNNNERLPILDFWRALSIALVMSGHLLPLGPKSWAINEAIAASGMVIFFTLSGFLITRFLIYDDNLWRFVIRRMARILPLAWLGMTLALLMVGGTAVQFLANLLFFANLPPFYLLPGGGHFWSLCVEVQFYVLVTSIMLVGGRRSLILLPFLGLLVTALRIYYGQPLNIITWFRLDEILIGSAVALIYEGWFGERPQKSIAFINPVVVAPLVMLSSHHFGGGLNYIRPYLAAAMIGASLYNSPSWMRKISISSPVKYLAEVSYALYVFHGVFQASWLGSGSNLIKYIKRPFLFFLTFLTAHFSTRYFEDYWVRLGRAVGGLNVRVR